MYSGFIDIAVWVDAFSWRVFLTRSSIWKFINVLKVAVEENSLFVSFLYKNTGNFELIITLYGCHEVVGIFINVLHQAHILANIVIFLCMFNFRFIIKEACG